MTPLPERMESEGVRLVAVSAHDAEALLAGRRDARWHPDYPRLDDLDAIRVAPVARGGDPSGWGPWHIVVDQLAVGSIGCFSAPADGEVEVGYGLVEPARGRGVASAALRCLAVETDRRGVGLVARTDPENRASLRVLAKTGFTELRGGDEDGNLVMARPAAPPVGSDDHASVEI